MKDLPDIQEYILGVTPTLGECESWDEVDSFTLALLGLIVPEYLELC